MVNRAVFASVFLLQLGLTSAGKHACSWSDEDRYPNPPHAPDTFHYCPKLACPSQCKSCVTGEVTVHAKTGCCKSAWCNDDWSWGNTEWGCDNKWDYVATCRGTCLALTSTCAECVEGKYGASCDDCDCSAHGTCNEGINGNGHCDCDDHWAGTRCQYTDSNACNGRGTISTTSGTPSYSCACVKPWTGTRCELCRANWYPQNDPTVTECTKCIYTLANSNGCHGHGTCDAQGDCICNAGWAAPNCEWCQSGWIRSGDQCFECSAEVTCNSHGECDINNLPNCICTPPFTGAHCDQCEHNHFGPDCIRCTPAAALVCNGHGSCRDGAQGDGTCDCTSGYRGDDCDLPSITDLSPVSAVTQGVVITLTGHYLGDALQVAIGAKSCTITSKSDNQILCTAPPAAPETVNVLVANPVSSNSKPFTYEAAVIQNHVPVTPGMSGHVNFRLEGFNFGPADAVSAVKVDTQTISVKSSSHAFALIDLPRGTGRVQLELYAGARKLTATPYSFTYAGPVITNIYSSAVRIPGGGWPITLDGVNFGFDAGPVLLSQISVSFGGNAVTSLSRPNENQRLVGTAPAGSGVQVVLVTNTVSKQDAESTFAYRQPMVVNVYGCPTSDGVSTSDCDPLGQQIFIEVDMYVGNTINDLDVWLGKPGDTYYVAGTKAVINEITGSIITATIPSGAGQELTVSVTARGNPALSGSPVLGFGTTSKLSYDVPQILDIDFVNPAHADISSTAGALVVANTLGGQVITMNGMSFSDSPSALKVFVGYLDGPAGAANPFPLSHECVVTASTTSSLRCTLEEIVGQQMRFQVSKVASSSFSRLSVTTIGSVPASIVSDTLDLAGGGGTIVPFASYRRLDSETTEGEAITFRAKHVGTNTNDVDVVFGDQGTKVCLVKSLTSVDGIEFNVNCLTESRPDGLSGEHSFTLITSGGVPTTAVGQDIYKYPDPPVISAVLGCTDTPPTTAMCPTKGYISEQQKTPITLEIRGSNFGFSASVTVGGVHCESARHDLATPDTKLYCTLPVGTGLGQRVEVSKDAGAILRGTSVALLSYAPPKLESVTGCEIQLDVTTAGCPVEGGVDITVTGTDFGFSRAAVLVGGTTCTNLRHTTGLEHYQVVCELPAGLDIDQAVTLLQFQGPLSNSLSLSYRSCNPGEYIDTNSCAPCKLGRYSTDGSFRSCQECEKGTFASTGGKSACDPCFPGTFSNQSGMESCKGCDEGKFVDTSGAAECKECPLGRFAITPGPSCFPCNVGTYQDMSAQSSCLPCPEGKAQSKTGQSLCVECAVGYYQDLPGQESCKACLKGKVSDRGATERGSTGCTLCQEGYYASVAGQIECIQCSEGTYGATQGLAACVKCPAGMFTDMLGSTECRNCTAGSFARVLGTRTCRACGPGTFSANDAASVCSTCPAGRYQPEHNQTDCRDCEIGKYVAKEAQFTCVLCPVGSYANDTANAICAVCPAGRSAETANSGNTGCQDCIPGKYSVGHGSANCFEAAKGQYVSEYGSKAPISCVPGTFAAVEGMSECQNCSLGYVAPALQSSLCFACPPGSFSAGQVDCELCPAGRYQDQEGQSECKLCAPGSLSRPGRSQCERCLPGKAASGNGSVTCVPCVGGYYAKADSVQGATECTACEPGRYTESTQSEDCRDCEAGRYVNGTANEVCEPCEVGRFSEAGSFACVLCPAGRFTLKASSATCDLCVPGKYLPGTDENALTCLPCPVGTSSRDYGAEFCEPCARGTFQPLEDQGECVLCPLGKFENGTGQYVGCSPCAEGKFAANPGQPLCTDCPAGKFNPLRDQFSCSLCQAGRFSPGGNTSCLPCPVGTFAVKQGTPVCPPCDPGTFNDQPTATSCRRCGLGQYQNASGQITCLTCPLGHYQDSMASSECIPCQAGRFNDQSVTDQCKLCPPGRASNRTGQAQCQNCVAGRFQNRAEQTECLPCGVGTSSVSQSVQCGNCEDGTAAPFEGMGACEECVIGKYMDGGRRRCNECQPGTYSANNRAIVCTDCQEGRASPAAGSTSCNLCVFKASDDNTKCVCDVGFYMQSLTQINREEGETPKCIKCPIGASCDTPGVEWDTLKTVEGWWRPHNASEAFFQCLAPEHCPSGRGANCEARRTGTLCAVCIANHKSSTALGECEICPESGTAVGYSILFSLCVIAILVTMFWVVLRNDRDLIEQLDAEELANIRWGAGDGLKKAQGTQKSDDDGRDLDYNSPMRLLTHRSERATPNFTYKVKIVVGFLQVATNLVFVVDAPWPRLFKTFISFFDIVNLSFVPWQSVSCVGRFNYYTKLMIIGTIPVIVVALLGVSWGILKLCERSRRPTPLLQSTAIGSSGSILQRFSSMRTGVGEELVQTARQVEDFELYKQTVRRRDRQFFKLSIFTLFLVYPNLSSTIMAMFVCQDVSGIYSLKADFSIRCFDATWFAHLPWAITFGVLYPLGIPALFFFVLWRARRTSDLRNKAVILQFGFLYEAYTLDLWFFELVDMAYKLWMTSLLAFFPKATQIPFGMLSIALYFMLHMVKRPFLRKADDRLICLVVVETYVYILVAYTLNRANSTYDDVTDLVLSIMLIVLTVMLVAVFIAMFIQAAKKMIRAHQEAKLRKNDEKDGSSIKSSTVHAKDLAEVEDGDELIDAGNYAFVNPLLLNTTIVRDADTFAD